MQMLKTPEGNMSQLGRFHLSDSNSNKNGIKPQTGNTHFKEMYSIPFSLGSAPDFIPKFGLIFEREADKHIEDPPINYVMLTENSMIPTNIEMINKIADAAIGIPPVEEIRVKMKFKIIE